MKTPSLHLSIPRLVLVALLAGSQLSAQDVPAGASQDQVFELSPFEVSSSNDRGYTATSSLAGGRLASDLRDTAAAVTVLTTEFLADIGVASFQEAAKWAPNAVPVEEVAQPNLYGDYGVQFRSLGSGFQSRNYFRWYVNSDTYNTARIEFSRGPNSLVFGDAGVGGVANVSSMQAQGSGQTNLLVQYNSWGGLRATADHDLKVSDNWSVRVAGVYQRFDDWRNTGGIDRDGAFITTTYKLAKRTTVRAEFEWGEVDRTLSFGLLENYSSWDGTTLIDAPIPAGTNLGSLRRYNADQLVYNSATPEKGITNWIGYGATFGSGRMLTTYAQDGLDDSLVLDSYKVTFQAPNGGANNPYYTGSIFLQHQFGNDLYLEVAANYQEQERNVKRWFFDSVQVEVNTVMPDGSANPYAGELFGDTRYWLQNQKNEVLDYRASLAYILNRDSMEHRFLVTSGHRDDRYTDRTNEWVRTNGTNPDVTNSVNRIYARRYFSALGADVLTPPTIDPVSGIDSRYAWTNGFFSEKPITYLQGAIISKWFTDRRLNTIVGARRDDYREKKNNSAKDVRDPASRELQSWGEKITVRDQSVTSLSYSAVYHILPSFSIFGGYSESYDPGSTAVSIDGSSLPALISNGQEAGFKLNLLDGKLVGSVTYYRNEQENTRTSGMSADINKIWSTLDLRDNEVDNYTDRQSYEGRGFELDFTAMPTPNWRLLFNIAFPETSIKEGLLDTRAYYDANIGFWNSELARLESEGETLKADTVANSISAIENRINSFTTGRALNDTFDYTANFFSRYYFTEGLLEGISLGGGANIRGKSVVGNYPGDPYDYLYADKYMTWSLVAGYETTIRNVDLSFQLNVANLFDKEVVRETRYNTYRVGGVNYFVPDRFIVLPPRQILFTVTAKF